MSLTQKYKLLREAVAQSLEQIVQKDGYTALTEEVLTKVVIQTLRTYVQRMGVGIEDSVTDLLDQFKIKVTQEIFDVGGNWRVAARDPVIFPQNCRFLYSKGPMTVAIIEQSPQIRTLRLSASLLDSPNGGSFALAIPYSVFVILFRRERDRDRLAGLYYAWRVRPLSTMDDLITHPLLPNIHDTYNVCTGPLPTLAGSISDQTEAAITHFWNSEFTSDLSTRWRQKGSVDQRLRNASTWEQNSREDPMFILRVNFVYAGGDTVMRLVNFLAGSDETPDESTLRHRLNDAITNCTESLFSKIRHYIKNVDHERHYPKQVSELLQRAMSDTTSQFTDILFLLEHELGKLKTEIASVNSMPVKRVGLFWNKID